MKKLIFSMLLLVGVTANGQNSILDVAPGYNFELSVPFPGDTIVHLPYVDLPTQMQLGTPHRIIEDNSGYSNIFYWRRWRISYHVVWGQRDGTTISRL